MSREIDERIVAMHFDNEQFERGARQSIKTLEDLKAGLNLEGTSEGLDNISKAVSNSFGLKKTTRNVGLFSKALNGMGKVAKGAFNFATAPMQAMMDGLGTVGKYTQTVLGFDIGSKIVNTGEQVVRAFTIDPMKSGWDEYELKMDSIKTIMSGTEGQFRKLLGDDYTEEKHLKAVKDALEELNKYADDTIYSFKDMTSNIGKFTNNGVELKTAVSSMKGISNAAARAGQGTQQASMAMYNFSQAIGMGKLTVADWKSIENANMATLDFKQSFIDVAAAMGKLEKIGDKYYLKEDENATKASKKKKKLSKEEQEAALKAREVTAENFRNTLAKGWADSDVITKTLALWSGDIKWDELMKWGFSAEEAKKMWDMADAAHDAATEVRTFSKMYDALKEAAQSGWAMSWELIFGDVNEATEFWSDLNKRFSKIIDGAAKKRNDLLKAWRGGDGSGIDGRDILITGLNRLLDTIETISKAIGKAWKAVFGKVTAETLMNLTVKFNDFTVRLKQWFGELDNPKSKISKLVDVLKGLFSVLKIGKIAIAEIAKRGMQVIRELLPNSGKLLTSLSKLGKKITKIAKQFEKDKSFKNLFKNIEKELSASWKTLKDKLTKFGAEVKQKFDEEGLGAAIRLIKEKIQGLFKKWGIDTSSVDAIAKKVKASVKKLVTAIESAVGVDPGTFEKWWNKIKEVISNFGKKKTEGESADTANAEASNEEAASTLDKVVSVFTSIKETVTSFIDWAKTTDWNALAQSFGTVISDLGVGLLMLGAGGTALGISSTANGVGGIVKGFGKLLKGLSNAEVTIGDVTIETKEGLGGVLKDAKESFSDVAQKAGSTVAVILEFSAAMYLLAKAIDTLSQIDDDSRHNAELAIAALTGLIAAFDFITKLTSKKIGTKKGASFTGLLGFVMSIHELVEDVVKLSDLDEAELKRATIGIAALTGLIAAFDALTKVNSKLFGSKGASLTGLIGFVASIHELTDDVVNLSGLEEADLKRATIGVGALTGLIAAFDALTKVNSTLFGKKGASLTGLIGFIATIHELVEDVVTLSVIDEAELKRATIGIGALTGLIAAFDGLTKVNSTLFGKKGANLTGLIGFVAAIHELTSDVMLLSDLDDDSIKRATIGVGALTGLITAFDALTKVNSKLFGSKGASLTGLIGFIASIHELTDDVLVLSDLDEAELKRATIGVGALTGLITVFDGLTKVDSKLFGAKGASLTGLIGFIVAVRELTNTVLEFSVMDDEDLVRGELAVAGVTAIITAFDGLTKVINKRTNEAKPADIGSLIGLASVIKEFTKSVVDLSVLNGGDIIKSEAAVAGITAIILAFESISTKLNNNFGNSLSQTTGLIGFVIAMTSLTNAVVKLSGAKNLGDATLVLGAIEAIILAFVSLSDLIGDKLGGSFGRKLGTGVSNLVTITGLLLGTIGLVLAVKQLADIEDPSKLTTAVDTVKTLTGIIAAFSLVIAVIGKLGASSIKGAATAALSIIVFAGVLGIAFAAIQAALDGIFGKDNVIEKLEEAAETMKALGGILGGFIAGVIEPLKTVFTGKTVSSLENASSLSEVIEPLESLSKIGENLNIEGIKKIKEALDILKDVAQDKVNDVALYSSLLAGEINIFTFIEKLPKAGQDLAEFNKQVEGLDFSNAVAASTMLQTLVDTFKSAHTGGGLYMFDVDSVNDFLSALNSENGVDWKTLSSVATSISENVNGGIDEASKSISGQPIIDALAKSITDNGEKVKLAIKELYSEYTKTASNGSESVTSAAENGAEDVVSGVDDYLAMAGIDTSGYEEYFNGFADQVTQMASGAKDLVPDVNGLVDHVSDSLGFGAGQKTGEAYADGYKQAVQAGAAAIGESLQGTSPTVTAVIDWGDMSAALDFSGKEFKIAGTVALDAANLSDLKNTMVNQTTRNINAIYESANNLGGRITRLESAIRNMKIVLNTGTVAGAVDSNLGSKAALGSRTMVSP